MDVSDTKGALDGLIVLDLSRILAGPTATQLLGDLGAEILKVENPKTGGDDTRSWGPHYAQNEDSTASDLSAYFMAANRNKKSIALDLTNENDLRVARALAARADVVVENYKPGGLEKYGLDHKTLCAAHPKLVYCSISGFGQNGPNRDKPGYDLMAQGYGGIMSLTGEPEGAPMKVGVGIADVMCGMYAAVGILAALRHRDATGEGQHIDLALVDAQMAWLINEGTNFLTSGKLPKRRGNAHPNIVPYEAFACSDGHILIAVGNDAQFARFCDAIEAADLAAEPRFKTNLGRIEHREELIPRITAYTETFGKSELIAKLESVKVPAGPINTVAEALGSDQAEARGAVASVPAQGIQDGAVRLLGNPLKLSRTPVRYRQAPPRCDEHGSSIRASITSPRSDT